MPAAAPFFERLSTLDEAFLTNESTACPMHVGAVLVLGAAPLRTGEGGVDFDRILEFISGALESEPRFRQRLHEVPFTREHVWVDDPDFQLSYHVRHTALPAPGDDRQLKRLAGRIFSQRLDLDKPLWEFWIVEGLEGGRCAVICKVHHCLTDGMGAVNILQSMVGLEPRPSQPFAPRPIPEPRELTRSSITRRLVNLDKLRLGLTRLRSSTSGNASASTLLGGVMGTLRRGLVAAPQTSLNPDRVGPHRRFDTVVLDMEEVKEVKRRLGGKVNDVVLATVARGLHRYFEARGESPGNYRHFRALVPASVRTKSGGRVGNHVSTLLAEIPVHASTAQRAYELVCRETRFLKDESNAIRGIAWLEELDDALGLGAVSGAFAIAGRVRAFNTIVTNVPGPPVPIPIFGAPLREIYALVPLFPQQALGIAIFSYAGKLCWGLNADWQAIPALHDLVLSMQDAFAELLAHARAQDDAATDAGTSEPAAGVKA